MKRSNLHRFSLRVHISFTIAIVALLVVALICLLANILLERQFERYAEGQRELRASDIAQNLSMLYYPVTKTWDVDAIHALGMYSMTDGYILLVRDANGEVVWNAQNHDMARCSAIMDEIAERMGRYGANGRFTARDLPLKQDERVVGEAMISSYGPFFFSEADAALLSALNRILVIVGLIALAAAAIVGFLSARRIARPALAAARATERIAGGDFAARANADSGVRELDELARAVNRLAKDLGEQHELRKRLTADIAHELRTPLAAVSVQIESMAEGVTEPTHERLAGCRDEILRLTNLVDGLKRLEEASANGDARQSREDTDIAALVRSVCAAWESEAAAKDIAIETGSVGENPFVVKVDGDAVAGALSNLLSNAVKYTSSGGRVTVKIVPRDLPKTVSIVVADTGPGIPESELPRIFERLYRADKSRNRGTGGAGLGLAIAREAIRANGGEITAENAKNGGAVFTIIL
ncbi:MAG: HAMP domain-containing protein [Clostridiales Family XIII bacterium]|jgi:signal transduction histidine kinase|nr:HAMP domain-containing protein [Clostridiales Family XIII bacterium]